jgi:hypothetical protein
MERLARGVVDVGDVAYFVTSPLVFLALCRLALQPRGGS